MSEERLITLQQAASKLGVSEKTVRRRIKDRALPEPVKIGSCTRIPDSAIDAYIIHLHKKRKGDLL